jgi:hypothetical protein
MTDIPRIEIEVSTAPAPGLLRAGIQAAVSGRPFPAGPESVIGAAVADAVSAISPVHRDAPC